MAAKRIYQIAKEFEREEKEVIEFLVLIKRRLLHLLPEISVILFIMLMMKHVI